MHSIKITLVSIPMFSGVKNLIAISVKIIPFFCAE